MLQKNKNTWKIIGLTALVAVLAGLGSMSSDKVYASLQLPALAPPSWLYGVVWPILYVLMAIATVLIDRKIPNSPEKRSTITLYWVQLVVNVLWPYVFFLLQARLLAFLWLALLLVLTVILTIRYWRLYAPSGWMLIPYVLWVAFATYLNGAIWLLNR